MESFHISRGLPVLFLVLFLISCGNTEDPLDPDPNTATHTLGTLKITDADAPGAPAAPGAGLMLGAQTPQEPVDPTLPRIVEVGFYRDSQGHTPITSEAVYPGDTIYTKVVFSKSMQLVAGNGAAARPCLYFVINGVATSYRMKEKGSFTSGQCKPIRKNSRDTYICRYTVRAGTLGTFTLKVGETSVDAAGVALEAAYVHPGSLVLEPGVLSLSNTTLAENADIGSVVGRFSTMGRGVRDYRLLDPAASNLFSIDALGNLCAKVDFNYEERAAYTVEVAEVRTQARERFEIQIRNVNEPPTALHLINTTFYKEDGVGTQITEVFVIDEDSGDVHEIEVTKGSEFVGVRAGSLRVLPFGEFVGVHAGSLEVLQLPDTPNQEIELQVTDRGGLRYKAVFQITMQTRTTATPPSDPDPSSAPEPTQSTAAPSNPQPAQSTEPNDPEPSDPEPSDPESIHAPFTGGAPQFPPATGPAP